MYVEGDVFGFENNGDDAMVLSVVEKVLYFSSSHVPTLKK